VCSEINEAELPKLWAAHRLKVEIKMAAAADIARGTESLAPPHSALRTAAARPVLLPWLCAQSLNVTRHAAALRAFRREEFGTGAAAPTEGHIQAVNTLMNSLRGGLLRMAGSVGKAVESAAGQANASNLQRVVRQKHHAHDWVQGIERIWDFYFELFGQRQGQYKDWLLGCDRIALDVYRVAYLGLGTARSVPAPPPFCYMRTGFAPATFGRGIPLTRLGRQLNPFPLIQLPYHRLVNPWTLGAMLHETSHNLQSDLELSKGIPKGVARRLLRAGLGRFVAMVWARWNREMFADMCALLLGGPGVVGSLMDVVGRTPEVVFHYSRRVPHPTPYLRTLISVELLRRMGFTEEAGKYRSAWTRLYSDPRAGNIPKEVLNSFPTACQLAVDQMCFKPYPSLGNRSLAEVIRFERKEQLMIEEAARRLAKGVDPGIIPERFLIGAVRFAIDESLASPSAIAQNFYKQLASG
jgi:hypothetical protein